MTTKTRITIALACSGLLAAASGCAQSPDEQPRAENTARKPAVREHASTSAPSPGTPRESATPVTGLELVNLMADDLAKRLGVDKGELQVLAAEPIVWNDGALGCPQPGRMYTHATVPGVRVLFQRSGKTYQYHGSERGHFVYCENPAEPAGNFDVR